MLPPLSRLRVSRVPESRLRHRCSSGYQRISPLHPEFRFPIPRSSHAVSTALSGLSPEISRSTHMASYAPFTPSKSEQRSPPLYYRGCWHRVSRGFLFGFLLKYHRPPPLFTAGSFFPHDRSLRAEALHPPRSVASSGLRPLRMILDCSLP